MIKYRKNEKWGTHSFEVSDSSYIDEMIKSETDRIQNKNISYIVDIVDISIRSTNTPETKYHDKRENHYITIMYALIDEKKERKEI